MHTDLWFETNQLQFAPEFNLKEKSFAAETQYGLLIFMKNWDGEKQVW